MKKITLLLIVVLTTIITQASNENLRILKDLSPGSQSSFMTGGVEMFKIGNKSYTFSENTTSTWTNSSAIFELINLDSLVFVCPSKRLRFNNLIILNNKAYSTGLSHNELVMFNGDTVKQLIPQGTFSNVISINTYGNDIILSVIEGGVEKIYKHDGTTLTLVQNNVRFDKSIEFNNILYFNNYDLATGSELWQYDGSTISLVNDYNNGTANTNPKEFTIFNNEMYYVGLDTNNLNSIFKYDGTSITNYAMPDTFEYISDLQVIGNHIYFLRHSISVAHQYMYRFDGTTVALVADLGENGITIPTSYTVKRTTYFHNSLDNKIYFGDYYATFRIQSLHSIDLSNNFELDTITTQIIENAIVNLTDGGIYYMGYELITFDAKMYRYDIFSKSVSVVSNLYQFNNSLMSIQKQNDHLYCVLNDSLMGKEWAIYDPSCTNSYSTQNETACDSYTWIDGNTYTTSNNSAMFTYTNGNSTGCDSTVILNLTLTSSANINAIATQNSNTIEATSGYSSYLWFDANGMISGETNATFSPTVNGDYYCEIGNNGCTKMTNTVSFVISGIRDFNTINVSMFPNPTTGKIEFVSKEKIASIQIYDLSGKQLQSFENTNYIDINNLTVGIYIAKIVSENDKIAIQKIFKK